MLKAQEESYPSLATSPPIHHPRPSSLQLPSTSHHFYTLTMPASPNVTYGIIGVGLMGIEHIKNLLAIPAAKVTCIADNYPDSIASCKAILQDESPDTLSDLAVFTNAKELLVADLCQVAIIATPNHTHHQVLMQAYRLAPPSLHILVEKPLCTTIDHCRQVIAAAQDRPGITYVGLEYCYMPPIARVIADTHKGIIGSPRMVSIREHRFPFLEKVRNWNRFSKNSGGTFVEKCCHFFDLFNRILHPRMPLSVLASGGQDFNHLDEVYDGKHSDIVDNGYVIVEYEGGRRACLDLCMFAEASLSQEEVSIVGPKGKLEAFLPQLEVRTGIRGLHECGRVKIEVVDDDRIKYRGHHHGSSFLEHLDILKTVTEKSDAPDTHVAGLYQGLLSVAIGVAAHKSVEEKRLVRLDELLTEEEMNMAVAK